MYEIYIQEELLFTHIKNKYTSIKNVYTNIKNKYIQIKYIYIYTYLQYIQKYFWGFWVFENMKINKRKYFWIFDFF